MGRRTTSALLSWVAIVALAGCDMREPSPDAGNFPMVLLDVTNENSHDVDIYAVQGGSRLRVARLWSDEDGTVEIGPPLLKTGEFTLEVYALGLDSTFRTSPITVMGQVHIRLRIDPSLGSSTFSVGYGSELDSTLANPTS